MDGSSKADGGSRSPPAARGAPGEPGDSGERGPRAEAAERAERAVTARAHRAIQAVLRAGLVLATVLMAVGLVLALANGELIAAPLRLGHILSGGPLPDRLMLSGMFLLSLTPLARVLSLIVIWLAEGDRRFFAIGLLVAAILALSLSVGLG